MKINFAALVLGLATFASAVPVQSDDTPTSTINLVTRDATSQAAASTSSSSLPFTGGGGGGGGYGDGSGGGGGGDLTSLLGKVSSVFTNLVGSGSGPLGLINAINSILSLVGGGGDDGAPPATDGQ